jgi:hypothetical protein
MGDINKTIYVDARDLAKKIIENNNTNSLGDILSNADKSASDIVDKRLKELNESKFAKENTILYSLIYPFAIILYIIIYIILLIAHIIKYILFYIISLSSRLSKLIGDIEFFNDIDEPDDSRNSLYERFLLIDLLNKDIKWGEDSKKFELTREELAKAAEDIVNKINNNLKNRLEKYKSLIKNLKDKQIKEDEDGYALKKWAEYIANERSNLMTKINADQQNVLFNNAASTGKELFKASQFSLSGFFKIIGFCIGVVISLIGLIAKYIFVAIKIFVLIFLTFFKSAIQAAVAWFGKWTRPFAGFIILLIILGIIIFVMYDSYEIDDPDLDRNSELSGLSGGSGGSGSNKQRFTYDENTNIFDALYRLPGEIYLFINDFTIFYNEFLKRITFFMNFSSEIMNDARNFAEDSIEYSRTDNINSEGINDNIYTYDASYIKSLIDKNNSPEIMNDDLVKNINANVAKLSDKVVHLIKPKDITDYTNTVINGLSVNIVNIGGDTEYKIKCEGDFFDNSCKIKQFKADNVLGCKNIDNTPKDNDYNNILL